jgi:hypothetical protein
LTGNIKNLKGLGGLKYVGTDLEISDCDSLVSVRDCGFTKDINLGINRCKQLQYLDFTQDDVYCTRIGVSNCPNFEKLSLSDLRTIGNAHLGVGSSPKFTNFNLIAADSLTMGLDNCPKISELHIDNVKFLKQLWVMNCKGIKEIEIIGGGDPKFEPEDLLWWEQAPVEIYQNDSLQSLKFPNARFSVSYVKIESNPLLETVDFHDLDRSQISIKGNNIRNLNGFPNVVDGGVAIFQSTTDSFPDPTFYDWSMKGFAPAKQDLDSIVSFKRLKTINGLAIDAHVKRLDAFDSLTTIISTLDYPVRYLNFANLEIDTLSFPLIINSVNPPAYTNFVGRISISKTKLKQPVTFSPGFKLNSQKISSTWVPVNIPIMQYTIVDNPEMTSLDNLSNFTYSNDSLPFFTIVNNPLLTDCSYICDMADQGYTIDRVHLSNNPSPCQSTSTLLDYCVLSVEETLDQEITIFPVPASSFLQIECKNQAAQIEEVILFNMQGTQMQYEEGSEAIMILDLKNLPSGLYCLTIRTKEGKAQQNKVLIVK